MGTSVMTAAVLLVCVLTRRLRQIRLAVVRFLLGKDAAAWTIIASTSTLHVKRLIKTDDDTLKLIRELIEEGWPIPAGRLARQRRPSDCDVKLITVDLLLHRKPIGNRELHVIAKLLDKRLDERPVDDGDLEIVIRAVHVLYEHDRFDDLENIADLLSFEMRLALRERLKAASPESYERMEQFLSL